MVSLPESNDDLRKKLNIPIGDLVFGRNGGWETFDIDWVKESIREVINLRNDIWFIFQFTEPFIEHERVIYLPGSSDLKEKVSFINTCDIMIHARYIGESFGLSCGEFSIRNKPVITWNGSPEKNHIDILGEKGFYYNDKNDIFNLILNLKKEDILNKDWNCYKDYTPEKVIDKFKKVYL
jgi:glycosyltransferase involved in cell wall biosynthesis